MANSSLTDDMANSSLTDDKLDKLSGHDIIVVIDDSKSMDISEIDGKKLWDLTKTLLASLAETMCTIDEDGIDMILFNNRTTERQDGKFTGGYYKIKNERKMMEILEKIKPTNGTPTGETLKVILDWYLPLLEQKPLPKPIMIPIITDGEEDSPGSLQGEIVRAVKALQENDSPHGQLLISLVQIGTNEDVKNAFKALDDNLRDNDDINRDIVDATHWEDIKNNLDKAVVKILVGALDASVDSAPLRSSSLDASVDSAPLRSS